MKQRCITPILIFFASVCLLCLVTGATAAPLISKYGFAPLFSIVKVKVPVFREFQAFGPFVFHESFGGRDIWGIRPLFSRLEEKKAGDCWVYENGDYMWEDEEHSWHLVRDGIDLLEEKKAGWCFSYNNGDYSWRDETGKTHYAKGG